MVKFTFKPFKSQKEPPADRLATNEPQNPYQKRREQVRRAQKTHRERKEAYVKSLETEVVQLRANEGRLLRETKTLYAEINAMKTLLANNGIPIPSRTTQPLPSPEQTTIEAESGLDEFFEFSISAKAPKQHERIQVRNQDRRRGDQSGGTLTTQALTPTTFDTILSTSTTTLVSQQNPTAMGMDFILSLEAPCLGHIPSTFDNEAPSGHALMASATLLHHQHHHHYPSSTTHDQTSNPAWTVHSSSVERLLELSSSIPLDGEVTPVQAWDYIRRHPQYSTLDCARLAKLQAALVEFVKCYGFGGVVDQGVFEEKVWDMFSKGEVFC